MASDDFNADRALKLIQQERILKKVYDKSTQKKEVAIFSIFKALILPDRAMMAKYRQTQ